MGIKMPFAMKCPTCGSMNDGASLMNNNGDIMPPIGSYGICFYCAAVYIHNDTPTPFLLPEDEWPEYVKQARQQIIDFHIQFKGDDDGASMAGGTP